MRVLKWLNENIEEYILMGLLIFMVGMMGVQVTMRYLFNASLTWSEELTRYAFVWSAFISVSYCIKRHISIKIDQFLHLMPETVQRVILSINKVIMLAFFSYMLYYAVLVVKSTYLSNQLSAALGVPIYLVQVSTVIGFSLAILRLIQSLLGVLKSPNTVK